MIARKRGAILLSAASAIATVVAVSALQPAVAQERKSIRWATSSTSSYGYRVAASMTKLVEEALGGEYTVTVNPYPQTTSATKAAMEGNAEIGYTADVGMTQLYAGTGAFKNYSPSGGKLVHTWYAYPMESFMATAKEGAEKYKCLKDFSGKPVFFTTAGFMNWLNFQRIFKALGYDFKHLQIDAKTNADALKAGTVVGSVAYTVAGRSLSTYWNETMVRTDVTVVNPCPDEIEKLKAAGLAIAKVDPKVPFKDDDVGVKEILGVPILFAYNMTAKVPEDVVYKMLSHLYTSRDQLVKADPGFATLANDFVGMQVSGINANPHIPVHPGLAKFLKEHKAWDEKWKVAEAG